MFELMLNVVLENIWFILVVGVASGTIVFVIGALWYSVLFGKIWMKARNIVELPVMSPEQQKKVMLSYVKTLVIEIIIAMGLFKLLLILGIRDIESTLLIVLGIAVITVLSNIKNYIFEESSWVLFAINEGYKVVGFIVMALVYGLFR